MDQTFKTIPLSIQFPSFAPSPSSSPTKLDLNHQLTDSQHIHRISIHLPDQYIDCDEQQSTQNTSNTNTIQDSQSLLSKVRVFCRMRPPCKSNLDSIKHDSTMVNDGENSFSFDYIFNQNANQKEVYDRIAKRHIEDFFIGKNSTIFAYGQTGSGKTHTMFGNLNLRKQWGIIPRMLEQLFKRDLGSSTISCSMVEIYNEKLMDLFNPLTNSYCDIKLKELNERIYLEGLQQILVQNEKQLLNLIEVGHRGRKVAATMSNDLSSRSHTILFVYRNFSCKGHQFSNKLCFIDLAGSEKVRKSRVKGQTLEETKKINLSLSCLGNVVHALTNGSEHIPYRNSKLTRILKDALSTDTNTSIITTCSLDKSDYNETMSTIKFAVRAKKIKNKKKLDLQEETTIEEEFIKLKKQLEETKKELAHYKNKENEKGDNDESEIPEERQTVVPPLTLRQKHVVWNTFSLNES